MLKLAHHVSDRVVTNAATAYPYKKNTLSILGHGIDTALFAPDGTIPERPPFLLSVGRLSPIKDLMTLLEATHRLRQRGYDIRCALVGDAPERDRLYAQAVRRKVQALNLSDIVQFIGAVPNHYVAHWYRRCFAHVNLCPTGALDKAALEAMACGKPSLIANEGFRDSLGRWADWLVFRHGDPEDLSRKLEQLSGVQQQVVGTDLRRNVVERHSLERLVGLLLALFQRVKCT
jgi:glycosyltransferase involved in cell wall biosynthesis